MFIENQPQDQLKHYGRLLKAVGSLSNLFSDAPEPYLPSRATENLFCKVFEAQNLSRSDASADASKNRTGFAIKTFLDNNGRTMQKVAEFNSDHLSFSGLGPEEKIKRIAELRNVRLESTKRLFKLDQLIYHCITRTPGKILVYETPAPLIQIDKISDVKTVRGAIQFKDPNGEYSFSNSKSTLYKRFVTENVLMTVPVRILTDPFSQIEKLIQEAGLIFSDIKVQPHVFLPLYSSRGGIKKVPEHSGLNQWNAGGRKRNPDELYIPIPAWIHKKYPGFFPPRDQVFELTLPDRTVIKASVCQDKDKALMSNPNSDLGQWLLRGVMQLPQGQLATYDQLLAMGLDSVVVYKVDSGHYDIDFTRIDSFEKFKTETGGEEEDDNTEEEE